MHATLSNHKVRFFGYRTSLREACIIAGAILCVLSTFGYSTCYGPQGYGLQGTSQGIMQDHCLLVSPFFTGDVIGKYLPALSNFGSGLLLIFAALFPSVPLSTFTLVTLAMAAANIIGLWISAIVEIASARQYNQQGLMIYGQFESVA